MHKNRADTFNFEVNTLKLEHERDEEELEKEKEQEKISKELKAEIEELKKHAFIDKDIWLTEHLPAKFKKDIKEKFTMQLDKFVDRYKTAIMKFNEIEDNDEYLSPGRKAEKVKKDFHDLTKQDAIDSRLLKSH
jgi:hypothetical protein